MAVITSLLLTRHGEAHCNLAGVAGGEKTCTGLTERGRTQVRLLAERLYAETLPDVLYAAPRRRVQESAQILSQALGLPVHIEPELSGPHHGQADGRPWDEIKAAFGGPPQSDPGRPYVPGSETWNQYLARAGAVLSGLIRRHDRQRILIAGHGETVDAAATMLLGLPPGSSTRGRLRIRSRIDHPLEHAAQPVRPGHMDTRRPERHPAPGQRTVTRSAVLLEVAKRVLGRCEVTAVLGDTVLRVRDAHSQEFVVKQHGTPSKHDREVHAYRHWTASLGPSAPRLIAANSAAVAIVITTLPGQPCSGDPEAAIHHQAGALLRRFHDTEPPRRLPWFPGWLADRISHWTSQAKTLLPAEDAAVVDGHLTALKTIGVPYGVPCHLDFQPRNWLVDKSRNLSVIDFEHARTDLPARDFVRLRFRVWPSRPDLQDAFFHGYGRRLTDAEDELVWHLGALDALTALARGRQTRDAALTTAGRATLRQLRERQR